MQLPNHGANPHALYNKLNLKQPASIIDFSENCNPAGPPQAVYAGWDALYPSIVRYPDPGGEPFLSALAAYHSMDSSAILLGNGAAELLSVLAMEYAGKQAIIVHPAFSEYEATLTAAGAKIHSVQMKEEDGFALPVEEIRQAMTASDVLYLCTPNNPTGILPSRQELLALIEHGRAVSCDVILDEAFLDWVDESLSFIPEAARFTHLTVVRSMTKMYAIPGIRLGYAIAHAERIHRLKQRMPHWNVNALAAQIGVLCLGQKDYRERAIRHAEQEKEKMASFLNTHGCRVIESAANYMLFQPPVHCPEERVFTELLTQGIVVRHTENFKGLDGRWLRIGMKTASDMERLRAALEQCFTKEKGLLTFISGGVRSGKSAYAEQLTKAAAEKTGGRLVYIASGTAGDEEMTDRIEQHQKNRKNEGWLTIEQPVQLEEVLEQLQPGDCVLWDCVTTWLANEAFAGFETGTPCILQPGCMERKLQTLQRTLEAIQRRAAQLTIVSNEVFDALRMNEKTTRAYIETLGALHQELVRKADEAIEMDSGLPIIRKKKKAQL